MSETPDERPEFLRRLYPRPQAREAVVVPLAPAQGKPYATKALGDELARLASAPQGTRNGQLNTSGFNLAQLVAAGFLDRDDVWHALHSTALAIGLTEHETVATLRSAFAAGELHPRQVSELDRPAPEPLTVLHIDTPGVEPDDDGMSESEKLRAKFPAVDWRALWDDETEDEWIVEPLLPARRLVALFSPPKLGKSLLMLELAVQISRGAEVLGTTPDRPRRVLYIDFENDPRGDIRSRLVAMGRKPADLENLIYLSFPQLPFLDTYIGGLELMSVVAEYEVEVVVIDTISRAVGGEENDNDTWLGFYRNTGMLLKGAGVACIRLDHTGKDQTKGMRGGSAKYGDVDAVWGMTGLTDDAFALDCTANRLPISEKRIVVRREHKPYLQHRVDTAGRKAVLRTAAEPVIAVMDEAGLPDSIGRDRLAEWMKANPGRINASARVVEEALRWRKDKTNPRNMQPHVPGT